MKRTSMQGTMGGPVKALRLTPVVGIALLVVWAGSLHPAAAPQNPPARVAAQQNTAAGDIAVWPVRGNIYMLVGAGGNVTIQVGDDGVLVVDTGAAPMG